MEPLHIVSWNVAGWSKCLEGIRKHCGTLSVWMDKHGIDILCLQEVKGNLSKLESSASQQLYGCKEPGFDSFFSLCTANTEGGSLGFNGVATFARKGLTQAANSSPLEDAEFDVQGRVLVTDHGGFVLFNVYAPYDGVHQEKLEVKMKFLHLLQVQMERQSKPIVLAGDLNCKYRFQDVCRSERLVHLPHLLSSTATSSKEPRILTNLRNVLSQHLSVLKQCLEKVEVQEYGGTVDRDGNRKVRVFAKHPVTKELKRLNPGELWFKSHALSFAPFDECRSSNGYVAKRSDTLSVAELRLFTEHLLDVHWTEQDWEEITEWEDGLYAGAVCTKQWMEDYLLPKFQDSFVVANPSAKERFTVWCSRTNARYTNHGSRVDYIFVDSALTIARKPPTIRLFGCTCQEECEKPDICALQACTAFGKWKAAPMSGGGLPEGILADFNTQFLLQQHTGMVYTSPESSDHIAVSCLVDRPINVKLHLENDAKTKASRPYAKQRSLLEFGSLSKKSKPS